MNVHNMVTSSPPADCLTSAWRSEHCGCGTQVTRTHNVSQCLTCSHMGWLCYGIRKVWQVWAFVTLLYDSNSNQHRAYFHSSTLMLWSVFNTDKYIVRAMFELHSDLRPKIWWLNSRIKTCISTLSFPIILCCFVEQLDHTDDQEGDWHGVSRTGETFRAAACFHAKEEAGGRREREAEMHRGRDGEREKEQGAGRAATQTGGRRETTVSAKCKITSICVCV